LSNDSQPHRYILHKDTAVHLTVTETALTQWRYIRSNQPDLPRRPTTVLEG